VDIQFFSGYYHTTKMPGCSFAENSKYTFWRIKKNADNFRNIVLKLRGIKFDVINKQF